MSLSSRISDLAARIGTEIKALKANKASAADLLAGTDDAKFVTAKGLKDAEYIPIHKGTTPPEDTTKLWLDTN